MLDLKYIKENAEAVKQNIKNRFMSVDVDEVLDLYEKRNSLIAESDALKQKRNENARKMKGRLDENERNDLITEGKNLKQRIAETDDELSRVREALEAAAGHIPNMAHPDAPVGKEDKDNTEIRRVGTIPTFDFLPLDHVELGKKLDLIDFDAAARVTGQKFYYLKNEAVFLELALSTYAMDKLFSKGFTPTITPDIAREEILEGIGFNPRGDESNIYNIEDTGTCLVGTAEITLGGMLADSILSKDELPIRLAGLSHCFRREAGAAGQYSRGLYRVHQFTKVEMFVFCLPEDSERIHEELLALEEEIFQELAIPYRVVDTCTGDLGAPAYRKFDLEAWMPGRGNGGDWGEVTSTSNCTDYQARRLGIRFRDETGNRYVHMLNGTAVAVSRALIALLENNQQPDGTITIPQVLAPYTGFEYIGGKS